MGKMGDITPNDMMRLIILTISIVNLFIVFMAIKKRRVRQSTLEFISSVSHELRTPLNAIVGYSELLMYNDEIDVVSRGKIEIINDSSNMMLHLINDILDHARLKSRKLFVLNESFIIINKVNQINKIHSVGALNKNLEFKVETKNLDINDVMYSDNLRFMQVLNNVISNAIKFTQQGEVKVLFEKFGKNLHIEVTDTGKGMDKKELRRVFAKFLQANVDIFKNHGGSGLGMFITKDLVRSMNGRIEISSEKNKGTKVSIKLPLNLEGDKHGKRIFKRTK